MSVQDPGHRVNGDCNNAGGGDPRDHEHIVTGACSNADDTNPIAGNKNDA